MGTVAVHYEQEGPSDGPAVILAPSLGTTLAMWDEQAAVLAESFRVIRVDIRGHGASPVPAGPYTTSELAADVIAVADSLGLDTFGFVGLSIGGAIGQTLAIEHPGRLSTLVLCCTGPTFGDPTTWRERAAKVRSEGMGFLVEPTKGRWFTPQFLEANPREVDRLIEMIAATSPAGYASCCDALADYDVTARLGEIDVPTRVIAGAQDPVSPPEVARVLLEGIPGADLVVIDEASHIANIAQPQQFSSAVREHLERHL